MTHSVSDDILGKFARKQHDWFARVRAGSLDPEEVGVAIQAMIDRRATYLSELYAEEDIIIDATKGSVTIANSAAVFPGYPDPDFKKWGTDKPGPDTPKTKARLFEMCRDGPFKQLFGSLGNHGWWQQGQIVAFCLAHPDKLRQDGYGTFFPFKVGEEEFAAGVDVVGGRLRADVHHFGYPVVWRAGGRHRVAVPQLTLST